MGREPNEGHCDIIIHHFQVDPLIPLILPPVDYELGIRIKSNPLPAQGNCWYPERKHLWDWGESQQNKGCLSRFTPARIQMDLNCVVGFYSKASVTPPELPRLEFPGQVGSGGENITWMLLSQKKKDWNIFLPFLPFFYSFKNIRVQVPWVTKKLVTTSHSRTSREDAKGQQWSNKTRKMSCVLGGWGTFSAMFSWGYGFGLRVPPARCLHSILCGGRSAVDL